ncbi:TIGR03564 family F420-dependent LLM class oxidoreductase [Amycolatopsis saalfeldensis]|uniref:F420-dependent oxidoreductase, MSMEG_4879 family n=1 Tax=Amycolatopsis saalfeldensis TaxID=394193 RepID=A0A1H8Q117_9PSEU|nr:TIGR03564 family F420-dependent LLM class oxidoreductase [Amycolatopsis saalfeldensis]SEO47624.1 F420-dependent oxidoreductase, MSMEG_4879 family [Amycolatopsis saalfeldensis]
MGAVVKIGLYSARPQGLEAVVEEAAVAERSGLDSVFLPQLTSWDALTVAGLIGQRVPRIGLGTAVVRTFASHPLALAGQALTVQAAVGGRLTLGIGPSHREIIEGQYGLSYDRPARHVREYLQVLQPLLRGETVDFRGETLAATGTVDVPGAEAPSVLVSALGPVMLRLAGELADGTVTVWTGADLLGDDIVPKVTEAARRAGRPSPRVVATVMAGVTADPGRVREDIAARFSGAGAFASYRRVLAAQGKSGLEDTVVAGSEEEVAAELRRFGDAGVTELVISPVGDEAERARTVKLVSVHDA